jgi:hypothetical protein
VKKTPFCIDGPLIYDGPIDITVRSRPGVIYHNQDFSRLALTNASLTNTTFVNCNLTECNLRWTRATSAAFINCDLSGLDTFGSGFTKVRFTNSTLNNAKFHATEFYDCDLGQDIANASLLDSSATIDTALPPGLVLNPDLDYNSRNGEPGLLAVDYDYEYLERFARPDAIDALLAEHHGIPPARLISCLRALSLSPT